MAYCGLTFVSALGAMFGGGFPFWLRLVLAILWPALLFVFIIVWLGSLIQRNSRQ